MSTHPRRATKRASVALAATLLTASTLSGCGVFGSPDLVIYNAQHEELAQRDGADASRKQSGLDVELRNGKDLEMANQIVAGGRRLPRRRLPHRELARDEHRRQRRPVRASSTAATLARSRPSTSRPTGAGPASPARSTVLVYNTDTMHRGRPADARSWTSPTPSGRAASAFSPSGADFQAIVSAVLELEGEQATADWLAGLKDERRRLQGNLVVHAVP